MPRGCTGPTIVMNLEEPRPFGGIRLRIPPRAFDQTIVVVLGVGSALAVVFGEAPEGRAGLRWIAVVLAIAQAVPLWWRRRRPALVLLLCWIAKILYYVLDLPEKSSSSVRTPPALRRHCLAYRFDDLSRVTHPASLPMGVGRARTTCLMQMPVSTRTNGSSPASSARSSRTICVRLLWTPRRFATSAWSLSLRAVTRRSRSRRGSRSPCERWRTDRRRDRPRLPPA
jgi:hypothetical protein